MTFITLVIAPLVIFLFFLIFRMNYAPQFRPQAYYRRKVGGARRLSTTTRESLVAHLRRILAPQYATRACEIATRMTKPAESVTAAADLLEGIARGKRVN